MNKYHSVYEFSPKGMSAFRRAFTGEISEDAFDPTDSEFAKPVAGSGGITDEPTETAKELAKKVIASLGAEWTRLLPRAGIWAWLAFVLRDDLYPVDKAGVRKVGEVWRWYPSDPGDWQKAQRHLVRMPVVLLGTFGDAVDHLLCGKPSVLPEVREQLLGQQDMLFRNFQEAARKLYFDDDKGTVKKGVGGKGAGSPRRLRDLRRQLDVTWNIFDLEPDEIVELLPNEFDRFKRTESAKS